MDDIMFRLITLIPGEDELGQPKPTKEYRVVYGIKSSIGQNEFHNAATSGLRPEFRISMFRPEYLGESLAEVGGTEYQIYRTFSDGDTTELYLSGKVGLR